MTKSILRSMWALPLLVTIPGNLGAQTSTNTEERIQRIVNALPPAILVKGHAAESPKLAERMAALHVPGVSIAYIHDGRIEWARGFGVTAIGGSPVTPDTLFQAASISKPVAAMGVLHLVQSGKLDLDTDINQYLKSWKLPSNDFTKTTKVTLRQLLTHSAGLTVHGFAGYAAGEPIPTLVQVLKGEKPANSDSIRVDTAPGTIWRYSGGGYEVAQQIVQDTTGEPFPKWMHDTVLGPVGMRASTYEQPLPQNRLKEAAMPYRGDGTPVTGGPHTYPEMAAAGLWTTPSDLARYAIEVQRSLVGASNHVLSVATVRQMLTPGLNHQGLGPGTGGTAEHPYFTHGGANEGYRCNLIAYNAGDGVVIMTNGDNGGELASEILRSVAREYNWPDFRPVEHAVITPDPKVVASYVGVYRSSPSNFFVTGEGAHIYGQLGNQRKLELLPESDHEFFVKEVNAQFTFETDGQGKAARLILHQNDTDETFTRADDVEAKRIADEAAARAEGLARRVKEQKAAPGSEAALRRLIEEIQRGEPDYSRMSPPFADMTRRALPDLKSTLQGWGALQTIVFKGVGPAGRDIFQVKFEKGEAEFRIDLTPDGKVDSVNFRAQ
ncbi:MAG TPA: serine hydrolase [Bryobacteraceae bacterium]|nr:serine hydrolase [Bryobacteraceae bacterium]